MSSIERPLRPYSEHFLPPAVDIPSKVHEVEEPKLSDSPVEGAYPSYLKHAAQDPSLSPSSPAIVESVAVAQGIHDIEAPPPISIPDDQIHLEDIPSTSQPTIPNRTASEKVFQLFIVNCWLVFFSIWGTLARLGFMGFTNYQGAPVGGGQNRGNGVTWANFAGCVVMGFLIENSAFFSLVECHKTKKTQGTNVDPDPTLNNNTRSTTPETPIPLYIGLTTGFCGSFTSFSSYMLQSFLYISNTLPSYNHSQKGFSVLSFLGYIVLSFALSVSGLQFGAQIAEFTKPYTRYIPIYAIKFLDRTIPFLAIGIWGGSIIMAVLIDKWRGHALFACVFSPFGAVARFWVSRTLNQKVKRFPLGTFIVNIFGTAVLAGAVMGQYGHNWSPEAGGILGCQFLGGIGDGFCGCLTTVSTWVVEIRGLRRNHAYQYAVCTIVVGTLTMIIILGSYTWTHDGLRTVNASCIDAPAQS